MLSNRITGSWGTLVINSDYVRDFFTSQELKKEIEDVTNYIFNKQPIAPRHRSNMRIKTEIRRGRWTSQITWAQENVYFRELHYKYLSKMIRRKYREE